MYRDHAYHQTKTEPIVSAENILGRIRTAIWVAEALVSDQSRLLNEGPLSNNRQVLDASVNLYVARVQIDLLSQLWEAVTGQPWRLPEDPELAGEGS